MRTSYLLSNKFKIPGWILFSLGIVSGLVLLFNDYEIDGLTTKVLTLFNEPLFGSNKDFFKIVENNISDELVSVMVIIGGLLVGFSKEKIEDEFIYKLRKDSLMWAILLNYIVLLLSIILVYDMTFFHVLVFNMFTPLVFFIIRFNFLKHKANSHDE